MRSAYVHAWLLVLTAMIMMLKSESQGEDDNLAMKDEINNVEYPSRHRRIKVMNLSPRNGTIIWSFGDTCNADLRFEIHGGTISFIDRAQMVLETY
jgi:hypothetical protein